MILRGDGWCRQFKVRIESEGIEGWIKEGDINPLTMEIIE